MKIFALGPEGTFGHMAAELVKTLRPEWNSDKLTIDFAPTHMEVLRRAETNNCLGIVAIRNNLSNNVPDSTAYLAQMTSDHPLVILDELWLSVEQCLLVRDWVTNLEQINEIVSFPQASDQCAKRVSDLGKKLTPARSTADAARQAAQDTSGSTAAIGNARAANLYGLSVLERGIQDERDNRTLFWIFGPRNMALPTNPPYKKSVVVCQIPDQIGSLWHLLGPLNRNSVDIEHLYTYRRGEHLKFIFELKLASGTDPKSLLAESATSVVTLGQFTIKK